MSDEMKSLEEFQKFYCECMAEEKGHVFETSVEVALKKRGSICFVKRFPINIIMRGDGGKVDIMWEEGGEEEFKKIGLYGTYNTKCVKMKYCVKERYLEIKTVDSNKIVRIYVE